MAIPPSKMSKPSNQKIIQKCSCDPLSKYDENIDSSWADWSITNCGGLAFREKNQWINADMGDPIMAALNKNRGYETVENKKSSYSASTKGVCCDIKFYYWIVRNGLIGKDKNVNVNYSKGSLNFHIVS